jgi:hypothetical protein
VGGEWPPPRAGCGSGRCFRSSRPRRRGPRRTEGRGISSEFRREARARHGATRAIRQWALGVRSSAAAVALRAPGRAQSYAAYRSQLGPGAFHCFACCWSVVASPAQAAANNSPLIRRGRMCRGLWLRYTVPFCGLQWSGVSYPPAVLQSSTVETGASPPTVCLLTCRIHVTRGTVRVLKAGIPPVKESARTGRVVCTPSPPCSVGAVLLPTSSVVRPAARSPAVDGGDPTS